MRLKNGLLDLTKSVHYHADKSCLDCRWKGFGESKFCLHPDHRYSYEGDSHPCELKTNMPRGGVLCFDFEQKQEQPT